MRRGGGERRPAGGPEDGVGVASHRRATSAGASCPGSLRAQRVARVDASDAARVAHLLETTPKTRPRTRAAGARASTRRWLVKRLGPDDTARAKRFLDADLAACARLLLDKLYERHLGRRGADAVHAVRAADPFDAVAVADAVVAAMSCADAAELPPPPPVKATRQPPHDRDDDCVQWCAPSEPRRRRRRRCAAAASCFGPLC